MPARAPAPSPAPRRAAAPAPAPPPAAAPAEKGNLTVICFPACDQIFDNGAALGPSPMFKRPVSAGEHRLRMVSANPAVTKTLTVVVAADETKTVRQPMTP